MYEVIFFIIAGLGAGFITGFLGASAVTFAAPILIIFMNIKPYDAVGISLAVDVFASLVASFVFHKNGNLKLKKSLPLLLTSVVFVVIGSYISQYVPPTRLSWITGLAIFVMGIMTYRHISKKDIHIKVQDKYRVPLTIIAGMIIGLIAGIFGAGGGLAILFTLVFVMKYRMHEAIGTSIMLMIFIALFGGGIHYYFSEFSLFYLGLAIIGGCIGSYITSIIANKLDEKILTKIIGSIFAILGLGLFIKSVVF